MKRVGVVAMVCVALAAGTGARAQAVSGRSLTSADKSSPVARVKSAHKAAAGRVRHLRSLQLRAIRAARRAQELAGFHPMSDANVEKHAVLAQMNLEKVMNDLSSAKGQSPHLGDVRAHEQQALNAARALVAAASARQPDASSITSNAGTLIQHAEAAEALLTAPTATDDWINP